MADGASPTWELDVRPRRATIVSGICAAAVFAFFLVGALTLLEKSTGVNLGLSDQIAMVLLGALIAGAVLLPARPRLRVGAEGALVRNVASERLYTWADMRGLSFPPGAKWARIELPDEEYVSVMALSVRDGERAVQSVRRFRELGKNYGQGV